MFRAPACRPAGLLWSLAPQLAVFLIFYAVGGTWVTAAGFGRRLMRLTYSVLQREADLRFALVGRAASCCLRCAWCRLLCHLTECALECNACTRAGPCHCLREESVFAAPAPTSGPGLLQVRVRENAESIAFYSGDQREAELAVARLARVIATIFGKASFVAHCLQEAWPLPGPMGLPALLRPLLLVLYVARFFLPGPHWTCCAGAVGGLPVALAEHLHVSPAAHAMPGQATFTSLKRCRAPMHPGMRACAPAASPATPVPARPACRVRVRPAPRRYATILLPSLLLSKRYFAGEIRFGGISQASFAFHASVPSPACRPAGGLCRAACGCVPLLPPRLACNLAAPLFLPPRAYSHSATATSLRPRHLHHPMQHRGRPQLHYHPPQRHEPAGGADRPAGCPAGGAGGAGGGRPRRRAQVRRRRLVGREAAPRCFG